MMDFRCKDDVQLEAWKPLLSLDSGSQMLNVFSTAPYFQGHGDGGKEERRTMDDTTAGVEIHVQKPGEKQLHTMHALE